MTSIEQLYSLYKKHPSVSTDTRTIKKGDLFFALKGPSFNGNLFAQLALDNGAAYVIIDEESACINDQCLLVEDVLTSLQLLATTHRKSFTIPFIGITGTNGKTTTKELIHEVLKTEKKVIATKGNLNNHIGVPLTILSLPEDTEIAIIEIGANHPGEIAELCQIAQPNYGIITNVGKAHLEGFGSVEGVKKTKKELYDFIAENSGSIFINTDNPTLLEMAKNVSNQITYGTKKTMCMGTFDTQKPTISFSWTFNHLKGSVSSELYGSYNYENFLAAVCIGNYFGISPNSIDKALSGYRSTNNRSQVVKTDKNTLFMDAYNANPSSMLKAIHSFSTQELDNKIVMLGDMLELGGDSKKEHTEIIRQVIIQGITTAYFVGKEFWECNEPSPFKFFKTIEECITYIKEHPIAKSNILIKGSRGIRMEKLVELL